MTCTATYSPMDGFNYRCTLPEGHLTPHHAPLQFRRVIVRDNVVVWRGQAEEVRPSTYAWELTQVNSERAS